MDWDSKLCMSRVSRERKVQVLESFRKCGSRLNREHIIGRQKDQNEYVILLTGHLNMGKIEIKIEISKKLLNVKTGKKKRT